MTTTYDVTALSSSTLYQIRFNLGDTDPSFWELQDEEILWCYALRGNTWGATAMCALALAAKYARLTSISADGVSQALQLKHQQFRTIAADYQIKETIYNAVPTVGGTSISDMLNVLSNDDRVPDIFRLGINDNPPSDGTDPSNSPPFGTFNDMSDEPV